MIDIANIVIVGQGLMAVHPAILSDPVYVLVQSQAGGVDFAIAQIDMAHFFVGTKALFVNITGRQVEQRIIPPPGSCCRQGERNPTKDCLPRNSCPIPPSDPGRIAS